MKSEIVLRLSPKDASDEKFYKPILASKMKVAPEKITSIKVVKRSIDARKSPIVVQLHIEAYANVVPPYVNQESYNFV